MSGSENEADLDLQYLRAELARIDVAIRRQVQCWIRAGRNPSDPFTGLYISDADATALMERELGSNWSVGAMLDQDEIAAFDQAGWRATEAARNLEERAQQVGHRLRLRQVRQAFDLDDFGFDTLLICLAPQLDLRYERVYGYLQDDVTRKSPSVNLILDLLGEAQIGDSVAAKIKRYDWGQSFFGIYVALDRPVPYRAGPEADQSGYVHLGGPSLDDLAETFAQCRSGLLPERPMIGAINEAGLDPSRVEPGHGLMKFIVHFVPYRVLGDASGRIRGTNWDDIKDAYADAVIDRLSEEFLPGLRDRVIARSVQSPLDYERRIISAVHGTHQHGAFLPYQVGAMRPIPEFGSYRSPVSNLYLCGAGSHPGSGVTMAPGRNAAKVICGDLRLAFPG